jgi:hypothetical protein
MPFPANDVSMLTANGKCLIFSLLPTCPLDHKTNQDANQETMPIAFSGKESRPAS